MAKVSFTGASGDGNLATGGNWDTASVPGAGDDAFIGATAYDLYGSIAANINSLQVTKGWTGEYFGGAAGDVGVNCNGANRRVDLEFGPNFISGRIKGITNTMTLLSVSKLGTGQLTITDGTITDVEGPTDGGKIIKAAAATITNIRTQSASVRSFGTNAFTTFDVDAGGRLESDHNIGSGTNGGTVITRLTATSTSVVNTPGSKFAPGGTGTHTLLVFKAGSEFSQENALNDYIVTSCLYSPKAKMQFQGDSAKITYTNAARAIGRKPTA